jgi:hypothetical protein
VRRVFVLICGGMYTLPHENKATAFATNTALSAFYIFILIFDFTFGEMRGLIVLLTQQHNYC